MRDKKWDVLSRLMTLPNEELRRIMRWRPMILVVRYIVRVNTTISNANANIQEMTRTGRLVRELSHICSEYERYTLHASHRRSISALINPGSHPLHKRSLFCHAELEVFGLHNQYSPNVYCIPLWWETWILIFPWNKLLKGRPTRELTADAHAETSITARTALFRS